MGALVFLGVDTRCPPAFLAAGFEVDLGVELASDRVGLGLEILLAIEIEKGNVGLRQLSQDNPRWDAILTKPVKHEVLLI